MGNTNFSRDTEEEEIEEEEPPLRKKAKPVKKQRREKEYDAEDDATAILENQTYLDKLNDRIQGHIQVDQDPAIKHEKSLNAALMNVESR